MYNAIQYVDDKTHGTGDSRLSLVQKRYVCVRFHLPQHKLIVKLPLISQLNSEMSEEIVPIFTLNTHPPHHYSFLTLKVFTSLNQPGYYY